MFFWSAFSLGLIGSLHCVGMCGPIALALPFKSPRWIDTTKSILLYQVGRILTYSLLGFLLGLLGIGLFVAGLQTYISLGLGILMLMVAFLSIDLEGMVLRFPWIAQMNTWVKRQLSKRLSNAKPGSFFLIGMLNGLIPCGLVYMAVIGAITMPSSLEGAVFMWSFGFGTLPLMLLSSFAGTKIGFSWRRKAQKMMPYLLMIIAVLFIYRGIAVHLPADYRFIQNWNDLPMCH